MKIREAKEKKELRWLIDRGKTIIAPLIGLTALSAATSAVGAFFVVTSKSVIDTATGVKSGNLVEQCAALFGVVLLRLVLQSLMSVINNRTTIRLDTHLKKRLFEAVMRKKWLHLSTVHSGDLMSRFTSDLNHVVSGVTEIVPQLMSLITSLCCSLAVLLMLDSTFAAIAVLVGPVVVVVGKLYSKKIKHLHVQCQESEAKTRSFIQESLQNLLLIKAFSNERKSLDSLNDALKRNNKLRVVRNTLSIISGIGLSLGYYIGYVLAIAWGSFRLSSGFITFGTMAAFLQLVAQIQSPFIGLAGVFPHIQTTIASAGRLMYIEEMPDEDTIFENRNPVPELITKPEAISMRKVSFSYQSEKILNNIDLEINKGEFVILAGPSGIGKTTILRLLLGLLEPHEGEIDLIDEYGIKSGVSSSSRSFFSYVPQGNMLFSGTIEDNIRYGKTSATMAEVIECARIACIDDYIQSLPEQYRTVIGERGLGLSEGQAQRIALARALMRDAPILLLDEATSALDDVTEAKVMENLRSCLRDKMCIFVSHRKSISRMCDRAYYLLNGSLQCISFHQNTAAN